MSPGVPYEPGGQGEPRSHVAAVAFGAADNPVVPGVHGEPEQLEAPAELYVPGKQLLQSLEYVAPTVVEYVPAGQ